MSTLRRWAVLLVALLSTTLVLGVIGPAISLWTPQWKAAFGASNGEIMIAATLNQIGAGLLAPFVALLVGRVPVRRMMIVGVLGAGLGLIAVGNATAMWQITVLHALVLSFGVILTGPLITQVLAVRLFQENRGLAIGVVTAGAPICTFTMTPLIAFLLQHFEWRTVEMQMGVLILCLVPLIFLVVRETPAAVADHDAPEQIPEPTLTVRALLSTRTFWGVLLAILPLYLLFNAIYYNLGFYLADLGATPADTAILISVMGMVSLTAVVSYGALADRVPHWSLLAGTVAAMSLTGIVVSTSTTHIVLLLVMPLMGFCLGGILPLVAAIFARRYGPTNFARANGFLRPFITFTAISPMFAGYARDALGSYSAVYTAMLVTLPVCVLGLWILRGPRPAAAFQDARQEARSAA